jgi:hypothetical protein
MGDENRFFRLLWRFNAILLAVVGVAGVVAIAAMAVDVLGRTPWERPTGGFAPVPGKAEQNATYRLDGSGFAALGREQILALRRWDGAPSAHGLQMDAVEMSRSSYFPMQDTVNAVAIDDSGKSHWLFRGYERRIVGQQAIRASLEENAAVTAIVFTVLDADTNKDGKFSEGDRKSLYLYRAGDALAQKILTVDEIRLNRQSAPDRYLIVSETGKAATVASYALPDFRLLATQPVPNVPE